ncbi:MAG: hypothetical protein GF320_17405 [Armatimonadia bacterium]|nr:hypothetical protein [Armatimonadia bacterium]
MSVTKLRTRSASEEAVKGRGSGPLPDTPAAVWVERGAMAVLTLAGRPDSAYLEPPRVETVLPDGRVLTASAATLSINFRLRDGGWEAVSLEGLRVRSVCLDGESLFSAPSVQDQVCAEVRTA